MRQTGQHKKRVCAHLELLRGAEAGAGGKEGGDLIAKGAVVGVFHHAHQLQRIVAQRGHLRQHIAPELVKGAHAALLGAHAHVRLVDAQPRPARRHPPVLPNVRLRRLPEDAVQMHIGRPLLAPHAPRRHPLQKGPRLRHHPQLHKVAVPDERSRHRPAPHAERVLRQRELVPPPRVKVAKHKHGLRSGQPLAHPHVARGRVAVPSKGGKAPRKGLKRALGRLDARPQRLCPLVPRPNHSVKRLQVAVLVCEPHRLLLSPLHVLENSSFLFLSDLFVCLFASSDLRIEEGCCVGVQYGDWHGLCPRCECEVGARCNRRRWRRQQQRLLRPFHPRRRVWCR